MHRACSMDPVTIRFPNAGFQVFFALEYLNIQLNIMNLMNDDFD